MRNRMLKMKNVSLLAVTSFILIIFPIAAQSARILGYFPTTSKSHLLIHCAVADTLASAGHDVTVLGGTPNVYKSAKYHYIDISATAGFHQTMGAELVNNPQPMYKRFPSIMNNIKDSSNGTMSNAIMQNFLKEHKEGSFDLVIIGYLMNEFSFGLGAHFKCPIIISYVIQPFYSLNKLVGQPEEYAYVPSLLAELKQPMNFFERVRNFITTLVDRFYFYRLIVLANDDLYSHHFPTPRYPPLTEVVKNVSLLFINHHSHSQGPIRPIVPALIEIGGIQIKEQPDPLPADLAEIVDNAKEGVIYFSLGSNVAGNAIAKPIAKAMFDALSKIPYTVLWKWGDAEYPGSAPNIFFKSWLPQNDILAHPNVKLFITHAGQGSVVESLYHGVPMVAIPLFNDQPANAANLEQSDYGVQVDFLTLTTESLRNAILEVLNNKKYSQAVKQFSKIYRDRPMTPRQLVVFWTEYVLRHNGARHLRSPALDLNVFQLISLDVILLLSGIIFSVFLILVKIVQCLFCRKTNKNLCKNSNNKKCK